MMVVIGRATSSSWFRTALVALALTLAVGGASGAETMCTEVEVLSRREVRTHGCSVEERCHRAYVASLDWGIYEFDVRKADSPVETRFVRGGRSNWLAVKGEHVLVADGATLGVYAFPADGGEARKVAEVAPPEEVGDGTVRHVTIDGEVAHVALGGPRGGGMMTVDIREPRRPRVVGWARGGDGVAARAIAGTGYVLLADTERGLTVVDTRKEREEEKEEEKEEGKKEKEEGKKEKEEGKKEEGKGKEKGKEEEKKEKDDGAREFKVVARVEGTEGVRALEVRGRTVYVGTARGGGAKNVLEVYNVSEPKAPKRVGSAEIGYRARHAEVHGDLVYVAGDTAGVFVHDAGRGLAVVRSHDLGGEQVTGLTVRSDVVFVSTAHGGHLYALRMDCGLPGAGTWGTWPTVRVMRPEREGEGEAVTGVEAKGRGELEGWVYAKGGEGEGEGEREDEEETKMKKKEKEEEKMMKKVVLKSLPEAMRGGVLFFPEQADGLPPGTQFELRCPESAGCERPCEFFVAVWHCPPCTKDSNGGLTGLLPAGGWEPRSCAPRWARAEGERYEPMVTFRREVGVGETVITPATDRELRHVMIAVVPHSVDCEGRGTEAECTATTACRWREAGGNDDDREEGGRQGRCERVWCPAAKREKPRGNPGGPVGPNPCTPCVKDSGEGQ